MAFRTSAAVNQGVPRDPKNPADHGVAMVGTDHRFVWVDPVFCQILGYTASELIGQKFERITHPQDVRLGEELAARFIRAELDSVEFDKRYIARDGAVVPVHLSASWVRDSWGNALYGVAVVRVNGPRIPLPDLRGARPDTIDEVERIRRAILD
jgi:PAS domain S-box-containing protein